MYISSARRYRPYLWNDVVCQDTIVTILRNEIINNTVANAYLFCGQRGVGKTTIARIFAKAINCENSIKNNGNPCQECSYCKSACIFELDAASNNSVEDIRNIIDQIRFAPNFNNYNVFIIDEAHMLSNAAFNAFLKTLEEPPQKTVFILATTERHKLPITIISRCQCFNFTNIPMDKISDHMAVILKNNSIAFEKESLNLIAEKSDGALRDALYMLDSVLAFCNDKITEENVKKILNILDDEVYFNLVEKCLHNDIPGVIVFLNTILEQGYSIQAFIDGLITHFMYLLLAINTTTQDLILLNEGKKNKYILQSKTIKKETLYDTIKIINTGSLNYKNSPNKRFFLEILLIDISNTLKCE